MTRGQAAVAAFETAGVDTVFGILGVHNDDTSCGATRHSQKIRLAEAYGTRGARLDRLHGLRAALAEGLVSDRMTAIEAPDGVARPDAVPLPRY
jgi:thiamine pyrophosphate-dependent acetolactate synthase large subunit-like protein